MKKSHTRRLRDLEVRIQALPLSKAAEDGAFEMFKESGELPEDLRLARAVTERALDAQEGTGARRPPMYFGEALVKLRETYRAVEAGEPLPRTKSLREILFAEAVHEHELVRQAARGAIKVLVAAGQDVTSEDFLPEDLDVPDYGTLGMHLLGFPECLVRPPYEAQAQRLLARLDTLREQVPRGNEAWIEDFAATAARFFNCGTLPDEGLMQDAVLVYGEYLALARNLGDEADAEVLRAFAKAARAYGGERVTALGRVRALAAEGRIP